MDQISRTPPFTATPEQQQFKMGSLVLPVGSVLVLSLTLAAGLLVKVSLRGLIVFV